jgi:hypothetical protein
MKQIHVGRVVLMMLLCAGLSSQAQQTVATNTNVVVPPLMNFTGVLTDVNGKPLTEVTGVTFYLYKDQQSGVPLWMETQNVQPDETGHYSVRLGATSSSGLPSALFATGEAHWLGVQVQGQAEQVRILFLSVPYALKAADAETLGGMPASAFVQTASGTSGGKPAASTQPNNVATSGPGLNAVASVTGAGTKSFIPIWTSSTALGNSQLFQSSAGNVGLSTTLPTQKFEVDFGNLLARGPNNFKKAGDTAFLYVGDTSHPIEAIWNGGLAIGTFKAPKAIFIADTTGLVGIGTTSSTAGILNTVANSKSVVGFSTVGWNAPAFSNLSGTDAIHATGGNGDPNNPTGGGVGVIAQGGISAGSCPAPNCFSAGGAGVVATGGPGPLGGPGLVARAGQQQEDFGGADGVTAIGGFGGGNGITATAGDGTCFTSGGVGVSATGGPGTPGGPGVFATGGNTGASGAPAGPGVFATGGNGGVGGGSVGADGIDAFAGPGTPNGLAGSFSGDVHISGNLKVSGTKSFRIDHPLDPANKYLYHAALESSEVLDLYTGNTVLGASGEAAVQLPDWFETLNRDFRYQLTAIGAPAPNLHIAQEIQKHSFRIAGGAVGMKVSWLVTGVRQDAWEKTHPMAVEEEKPGRERGYYINPELFGAPPEKSIEWARHAELMKRMREMKKKQTQHMQATVKSARQQKRH